MSCANCRNLRVRRFNYQDLVDKWNELYAPSGITEGYEKRMKRESLKLGIPFNMVRMRFVYCEKGVLSRFYIVRGSKEIKPKVTISNCQSYV